MNEKKITPSRLPFSSHFLLYTFYGFLIAASVNLGIACFDDGPFQPKDDEPEVVDIKKIKSDANNIQQVFAKADTSLLATYLTESSLGQYKEYFVEIQPYMDDFAKAIENRELIFANPLYAVYSFQDNGKTYTFEMTLGDDGNWKITRF